MVNSTIAIIPARGGSKRIPQKNTIDFMGKPMLAHTILAAYESGCADRVFVSTEDEHIAKVAEDYRAEVLWRDSLFDDYSPISAVTCKAIRQFISQGGKADTVIQLMANCPMRTALDIRNMYQYFKASEAKYLVTCFKFGWMNPWWALQLDSGNVPTRLFPEAYQRRSQDLPSLFCPSGAIWMADVPSLLSSETFYGEGYKMFPISIASAIDIDDVDDLEMAKALYRMRNNND